jgi:dihydrofolate reductase
MVYPVLLGDGKRLFSNITDMAKLKLVEVEKAESGVLMLRYAPAGS